MFRRIRKTKHKSRQAFTLVELIVVLVILAVIAAATVPALTGYIKRTKKAKYLEEAQYALTAAQAVMTELYGLGPGSSTNLIYDPNDPTTNVGGGKGGDVRWDDQMNAVGSVKEQWGVKVLQLMDRDRSNEPYIFVFAVGHPEVATLTLDQKYTVYYVGYVKDENSPAVFYVNGDWIYTYPKDDKNIMSDKNLSFPKEGGGTVSVRNVILKDGVKIPIQFYVVSTYAENGFWSEHKDETLWGHSESNDKWK